MLTKYAEAFEVLDVVAIPRNAGHQRLARARRHAHRHHFDYTPRRGYIYVRSRAISSRCNDNFDEFPAAEIKAAYRTFIGKPVFVNHHNADHRRARGVIIDAALHEDTNPDGSEDTWAEVLMEVDAVRFPVLAREVMAGNIARTSMGTDVAYSVCTACGNRASSPAEYCQHIPKLKGMKIQRTLASGAKEEVLIAERCYGLGFFENSLLVEDPADPTAFTLGQPEGTPETLAMFASIEAEADRVVAEAERITRTAAVMDDWCTPCAGGDHGQCTGPDCPCAKVGHDEMALLKRQRKQTGDWFREQTKESSVDDLFTEAFRYDTEGHEYDHPYGGTRPQKEKVPAGSRTLEVHPDKAKPGYGAGSAERLQEGEHKQEDYWERQRRQIQRQRAKERDQQSIVHPASLNVEAGQCVYCNPALRLTGSTLMCDSHAFQAAHGSIDFPTSMNMSGGGMFDYPDTNPHPAFTALMVRESGFADDFPVGSRVHSLLVNYGGSTTRPEFGGTPGGNPDVSSTRPISGEVVGHTADRIQIRTDEGKTYFVRPRDTTLSKHADSGRVWSFEEIPPGWGAHIGNGEWVTKCPEPGCGHPIPGTLPVDIQRHLYDVHGKDAPLLPGGPGEAVRHKAYGETKAPAQVDTMRAENCPVCGDDEGFNGEKCNVCGYMQPPSQFRDPDLSKAREMDLRQDAQEQAGMDPAAPEDLGAPEQAEDLQCTNCGEVFSAEGDAATTTDDLPAETTAEEADPERPGEPPNGYGEKADDPHDLGDLADATDEDLFDDENAEKDEKDEDDPEEPEDPTTTDPAVGESRVTGEDPIQPGSDLDTAEQVAEGDTCPVCGMGTLVPLATRPEEDGEPKTKEVGTETDRKKPVAGRHGYVQKEMSTDMTQQPNTQPNPAQQRRSLIVGAIREQQGQIAELQQANAALMTGLASLAVAAGVDRHPHFEGIVRAAGLKRQADDTNNSPEDAPATSTEQAKKPDATDNVEDLGAAPAPANANVTPDAVTDVNNSNVAANPPVLDNLQSVTDPVGGTDAPTPAAGDAGGTSQVSVGTPEQKAFDTPAFQNTSAKDREARFIASVRLARLQIEAGIETGEDMALGQRIADSQTTLPEINAQISALTAVASRQAQQPQQQRQATRHLVPQRAAQGVQPSRQPSLQTHVATPTGREGEDEFMVGMDGLG